MKVLPNSRKLGLPVSRQTIFFYIEHLLNKNNNDEALKIFELFIRHQLYRIEIDKGDYFKMLNLLDSSNPEHVKMMEQVWKYLPKPYIPYKNSLIFKEKFVAVLNKLSSTEGVSEESLSQIEKFKIHFQ
jgi:hypothetical protein